jgi:hypothetical protein
MATIYVLLEQYGLKLADFNKNGQLTENRNDMVWKYSKSKRNINSMNFWPLAIYSYLINKMNWEYLCFNYREFIIRKLNDIELDGNKVIQKRIKSILC